MVLLLKASRPRSCRRAGLRTGFWTDAFGNVIGDSLARSSVSGGAASEKASDDPLGDLIKRNDGWAGVSATQTFAEDRATRQTAINPYGLPLSMAAWPTQLVMD